MKILLWVNKEKKKIIPVKQELSQTLFIVKIQSDKGFSDSFPLF